MWGRRFMWGQEKDHVGQEKVHVGAREGSLITSLPEFIFKVFSAGVIPRLLK